MMPTAIAPLSVLPSPSANAAERKTNDAGKPDEGGEDFANVLGDMTDDPARAAKNTEVSSNAESKQDETARDEAPSEDQNSLPPSSPQIELSLPHLPPPMAMAWAVDGWAAKTTDPAGADALATPDGTLDAASLQSPNLLDGTSVTSDALDSTAMASRAATTAYGLAAASNQVPNSPVTAGTQLDTPSTLERSGPNALQIMSYAGPGAQADVTSPRVEPNLATYRALLSTTPQQAAFPANLGAEVRFLLNSGLQSAELHLNPPELGPIRIQLSLSTQAADITFTAAHALTREGISQSIPALRAMLEQQGLQLGQADVSSGQGQQSQHSQHAPFNPMDIRPKNGAGSGLAGDPIHGLIRVPNRMLDLYA